MEINFSLRREALLGLLDLEIKMEEIKQTKKRYWLRGGLITLGGVLIITLIFSAVFLIFFGFPERDPLVPFIIFFLPGIIPMLFLLASYETSLDAWIFPFVAGIFSIISWFLIGSLIGWFYGRRKNKGK